MAKLLLTIWLVSTPLGDSMATVDVAEVNTFGGRGSCQIILWEWSDENSCFVVVAWRMVETDDEVERELRKVAYRHFRETWTLNDPEVDNRDVVPQHRRRKIDW